MADGPAAVSAPTTTRCCRSCDNCGRLGARGPLCGRLSPGRLSRPPRMSIRVVLGRPQRGRRRRPRRRQRERRCRQQRSHTADGASCTANGSSERAGNARARRRYGSVSFCWLVYRNVKRRTRRRAGGTTVWPAARVDLAVFSLSPEQRCRRERCINATRCRLAVVAR